MGRVTLHFNENDYHLFYHYCANYCRLYDETRKNSITVFRSKPGEEMLRHLRGIDGGFVAAREGMLSWASLPPGMGDCAPAGRKMPEK